MNGDRVRTDWNTMRTAREKVFAAFGPTKDMQLYNRGTRRRFAPMVSDDRRRIELAYSLGIPTMRVNTGRWRTTKDFDELMKNRGIEPRPAFRLDDGCDHEFADCWHGGLH